MADKDGIKLHLATLAGLVAQVTSADVDRECPAAVDAGLLSKLGTCVSACRAAVAVHAQHGSSTSGVAAPSAPLGTQQRRTTQLARALLAESQRLWAWATNEQSKLGVEAAWGLSNALRASLVNGQEQKLDSKDVQRRTNITLVAQSACDLHAMVDQLGGASAAGGMGPAVAAKLACERLAMCLSVGSAWAGLEQQEKAEVVLSVAQRTVSSVLEQVAAASATGSNGEGQATAQAASDQNDMLTLVFDLYTLRAAVLSRLGQHALVLQMAADCNALLRERVTLHDAVLATMLCAELAHWLLDISKSHLQQPAARSSAEGGSDATDHAVQLLKHAFELIEHALAFASTPLAQSTEVPADNNARKKKAHAVALLQMLEKLRTQVMTWLCACYVQQGDGTTALRYLDAMTTAGQPLDSPALISMRIKALLLAGKQEAAELELTNLAPLQGAPLKLVMECIDLLLLPSCSGSSDASPTGAGPSAVIKTRPARLLPVVEALMCRFPDEQAVVMAMFLMRAHKACNQLSDGDAAWGSLLAATCVPADQANDMSRPTEIMAQRLISHVQHIHAAQARASEAEGEAGTGQMQQNIVDQALTATNAIRQLLLARGTKHFELREFDEARVFYQACISYSNSVEQELDAHKACALCCLATGQLDLAWGCLEAASQALAASGSSVLPAAVLFMRLKVCLGKQDGTRAAAQLKALQTSPDYTPALLEAVIMDAVRAGQHALAAEALSELHRAVVEGGEGLGQCEADVLRVQIKCWEVAMPARHQEEGPCDTDNGSATPANPALHDKLARLYGLVQKRLDGSGMAGFFGDKSGSPAAVAGIEWFGCHAWAAGVAASNDHCYQSAAVLFVACANILGHHPVPAPRTTRSRRLAHTMAAFCALEVHLEHPDYANSLELAQRMVHAAKAISRQPDLPGASDMTVFDSKTGNLDILAVYHEVLVAVRMCDHEEVRRLLYDTLPALPPAKQPSASQLLGLAHQLKDGQYQHVGHARQCMSLALQQLARQVPPSPEQTCEVLCELVELSGSDTEKLQVLREAQEVLSQVAACVTAAGSSREKSAGRDSGSATAGGCACFPPRYMQWLVASAWNRGAHHARFLQCGDAAAFMRCALELLAHTPVSFAIAHKAMMQQQLAVQEAAAGSEHAAGITCQR